MITITNPGGLVIIVTLTKHENKRINNNNQSYFAAFYLFNFSGRNSLTGADGIGSEFRSQKQPASPLE